MSMLLPRTRSSVFSRRMRSATSTIQENIYSDDHIDSRSYRLYQSHDLEVAQCYVDHLPNVPCRCKRITSIHITGKVNKSNTVELHAKLHAATEYQADGRMLPRLLVCRMGRDGFTAARSRYASKTPYGSSLTMVR